MYQQMIIQIGLNRGGVVAVRALEGLHPMHAGVVPSEIRHMGEPLSAFTTFEGLLTRVYTLVLLSTR